MKSYTDAFIDHLYLDWLNNFISVDGFADGYGLTYDQALQTLMFIVYH